MEETVHHLKTIEPYFSQVSLGLKGFELRKNDRDFKVGDILVLQNYEPDAQSYTGEIIVKSVTTVLKDCPEYGLMHGYCVLGIIDYNPYPNQPPATV